MGMIEHTYWYFVSRDPDQLMPSTVDTYESMPHYRSEKDAVDAIKNDEHGEIGTLYVIKADLSVAATATRSWTLVAGDRPEPADPFADPDPREVEDPRF